MSCPRDHGDGIWSVELAEGTLVFLPRRTPDVPEVDAEKPATLADLERRAIAAALERTGGNRKETAEQLGISERSLYRRLAEVGR